MKVGIMLTSLMRLLLAQCPLQPKTVYVSADAVQDGSGTSWQSACRTNTAGLALSASGDELYQKPEESIVEFLRERVVAHIDREIAMHFQRKAEVICPDFGGGLAEVRRMCS